MTEPSLHQDDLQVDAGSEGDTNESLPGRSTISTRTKRLTTRWSTYSLASISTLTGVLYIWGVTKNGLGNAFYAAAVKSGTVSLKAAFFGSLDPGSFITVDKPPVALWVQEIFAKVLGFSSFSILLPEVLAGVATTAILYRTVERWKGSIAATIAATVFALTPVATVMFRFNNPDAILTLLLVASAWAMWRALETAKMSYLYLFAVLTGTAFLTKTLQATIILPALTLAYLVAGRTSFAFRFRQLIKTGIVTVVASFWWVVVVQLWPASSRPYVGGSTDNSELNLIFGYNGLSRVTGSGGGPGTSFAGGTGLGRLFNSTLGGQISWLLPFALLVLLVGAVLAVKSRSKRDVAGYLLWGGWLVLCGVVFSFAKGVFHPYYSVELAPSIAALVGVGSVTLWRLVKRRSKAAWMLPLVIIVSTLWSSALLDRTPTSYRGLRLVILVVGIASAIAFAVVILLGPSARRILVRASSAGAAIALLAGPAAYSINTVRSAHTGANPIAGPTLSQSFAGRGPFGGIPFGGTGPGGFRNFANGTASPSTATTETIPGTQYPTEAGLIRYLIAHRGTAKYIVATASDNVAEPLILESGLPIMAMGGFTGSDPAPTLTQFEKAVNSGVVRYVIVGGTGSRAGFGGGGFRGGFSGFRGGFGGAPSFGGGMPSGAGTTSTVPSILTWVEAHGTIVSASNYGGSTSLGTLYLVR